MKFHFSVIITCLLLSVHVHAQCWQQVAAGGYHTAAIKSDSTLWTWGRNDYGQLGIGSADVFTDQTIPVQVGQAHNWQQVAAGDNYMVAIKADSTLWAWGDNFFGQVGDGTNTAKHIPVQIGTAHNWQQVAARGIHAVALKSDGTLWTWGWNADGQLGIGSFINKNSPVQIGSSTDWKQVSAGLRHTIAIKSDGSLWAWGWNAHLQLGVGWIAERIKAPMQVGTAHDWQEIAPGFLHTTAIKSDGTLWGWGWNDHGQVGDGTNTTQPIPVNIDTTTNWQQVQAGTYHNAAIKSDGTLWVWGLNNEGQLGNETNTDQVIPLQIGTATNWEQVIAGYRHTFSIQSDGQLWAWGQNGDGQLGDGSNISKNIPTKIACPTTRTKTPLLPSNNLQISPNPAQDQLTIQTTNIDPTGLHFEIRNILGEVIYIRQYLGDKQEIDISQLTAGVYILIVSNQEGQVARQFVKI